MPNALALSAALLGSMYLVARPAANQFEYYSAAAAFSGLLAVLFLAVTGIWNLTAKPRLAAPESLTAALVLWLGIFAWSALRSPNYGQALPLACDAATYGALLLGGYFIGRREPALVQLFARLFVAMVLVEAFASIWQVYVDLPRLQQEVHQGRMLLPESMQSKLGMDRFKGDDAFGSIGHPNSLAAYLLAGIWLLAGLCWERARGLRLWLLAFFALVLGYALYLSSSKGAWVACLSGAWFFAAQRLATRSPQLRQKLKWITIAAVVLMLAMLVLGVLGAPGSERLGLSMHVRFEYWKAGLQMFARHPLDGVGLGGFAEYYSFFKTPAGWEAKDAHNDYVQLLAEVGILGPIVYLSVWWLLLRQGRSEIAPDGAPAERASTARAASLEKFALASGVAAFFLIFMSFDVFNAPDLAALFTGTYSFQILAGTLETLALPFVFAFAVIALRYFLPGEKSDSEANGAPISGDCLFHGFRAAAGAVLIHELVDFDFKAQAVMTGLFLLGGLFMGRRDAFPGSAGVPPATGSLAAVSRLLLPLAAVALIPGVVWFPLFSGLARTEAESLENEAKLRAKALNVEDPKEYLVLARQIIAAREEASRAAPFDAEALIDLALARVAYQRVIDLNEETDILPLLKKAVEMRPMAANPRVLLGSYFLQHGVQARPEGNSEAGLEDFKRAQQFYAEAVARYPLHPGLRLMEGDAWLLQFDLNKAAEVYWQAFEIDTRISDSNVYLSGLFTDPRPGAFAKHGKDYWILTTILLNRPVNETEALTLRGLLVRQLAAYAFLFRDAEKTNATPESWKTDFLEVTRRLPALFGDTYQRAHAMLLYALSFELADKDKNSENKTRAWEQAVRLQQESIKEGRPGTPPDVFNALVARYFVH